MKRIPLLFLVALVFVAACQPVAATAAATVVAATPLSPTQAPATRTLTVFAASSLTGAFKEIGTSFEASNPGVKVAFDFGSSSTLRTQIEQGASADVFASADHKNMDALVTDSLVGAGYKDLASNLLIVVLDPKNSGNVQTLQDLAKPGLKLILADSSVPAGNYARQILTTLSKDPLYGSDFSTKVLANVVSNETDVKQVVAKVDLAEADAGIVYVTDALAAPDLKTITIPDNVNVIAKYPIAAVVKSANADLAASFVAYVLSPAGQMTVKKWGFTPAGP